MGKRILIIDDEVELVAMLRETLRMRDYEVETANNGQRGLEMVKEVNPDAIICDLMMPGMSGLEVCRRLRSDPETKDIPLLVMSALGSESDKPEEFWAAGLKSDDFLSKPFEPQTLMGRLEFVLRKRQYVSSRGASMGAGSGGKAAGSSERREAKDLTTAAPADVVRAFIESWNTQDFETEFESMAPALRGGLNRQQYAARRRQIYRDENGDDRRQKLVREMEQSETGEQAVVRVQRKDTIRDNELAAVEEYRLSKTPEGWKIAMVKRAP